jgi:hypothetical protein
MALEQTETGLDVDPPDKPIKSLKDFAVHILTVTIGILIALGLDALVDAHRHHTLVEHARADFRAEFTQNRDKLALQAAAGRAVKQELEGLIAYGQARLANQPATVPAIQRIRSFVMLPSTAWDTAIATQAFLYLPFTETREISAAYSRQQVFNTMEARAEEQWFSFAGLDDPKDIAGPDLKPALEKFSIAYAYLLSLQVLQGQLLQDYDRALKAMPD